jgi:hypothetical protein
MHIFSVCACFIDNYCQTLFRVLSEDILVGITFAGHTLGTTESGVIINSIILLLLIIFTFSFLEVFPYLCRSHSSTSYL